MADVKKWFRGLRLVWFVGAVVAFGFLWFIELPIFLCHPHWQLLLRELAFALLISSVFGLTIEQVQRKEFIRLVTEERDELKRDVFLYAYGYNLPEQIREEIRCKALNSNFVRRDLALEWEFSEPVDGWLSIKKRYSYHLCNNDDSSQVWPFRFTQISADDGAKGPLRSTFHILKIRRKGQQNIEEIKLEAQPRQEPHKQVFQTDIKIAAHEELWIHYEVTHVRRENGNDNYNSRDMIVGVTRVKLRFPQDVAFQASVSCKQKQLVSAPDGDPPALYSFELTEGLFPHQPVVISWSKVDKKEAAKSGGAMNEPTVS